MKILHPTISEIEDTFYKPSDDLLMRVAKMDEDVPIEVRNTIEADPESMEFINDLRSQSSKDIVTSESNQQDVQLPEAITDFINRRVATSHQKFSSKPTQGQIIAVDAVIGPNGDLGWDLPYSLAVLIDCPSVNEDGSKNLEIWNGWMVSSESDYASYWDFILTEQDDPIDPLVSMIQVWNPVQVYLKSTNRVLGELSLSRLTALREIAEEFIALQYLDPTDARPGHLGLRKTIGGNAVLTGTPLSGEDDPRWRYQEIYHDVAEAIRLPARLAQEALNTKDYWQSLLVQLVNAGQTLGKKIKDLIPTPIELIPNYGAAALGGELIREPESYQLGNIVEIRFVQDEDGLVQMTLNLKELDKNIIVRLDEEGRLPDQITLSKSESRAVLSIDPTKSSAIQITESDGKVLYILSES